MSGNVLPLAAALGRKHGITVLIFSRESVTSLQPRSHPPVPDSRQASHATSSVCDPVSR